MGVLDIISQQPWLMTEEALAQVIMIADRQGDPAELQALMQKSGTRLVGARNVQMIGGTAIVPVTGPIFRYANLMTEISGATSTEILARDIRAAIDDPLVKSVILDVNSPGGAVAGISELADMIYQSRGSKPIVAYGGGQVASAAYWIASAADQMVIDRTAIVGSIGAIMSIVDTSQRDARSGVRTVEIVSSQSPDKRIDVAGDEGRAKMQKIVDDLAGVFVDTVARNRDVSVETVLADYGRGGVMVGQGAVDAGLADRIGSLESVLTELAAAHEPTRRSFIMATASKTGQQGARGPIVVATTAALRAAIEAGHTADEISLESVDVEALRAETRAAVLAEVEPKHAEAVAAAEKKGIETERARIVGLQGIAVKGFEANVNKAIESGATVEATAVEIAKAQRSRGTTVATIQGDSPAAVGHAGADTSATAGKGWGKITARANTRVKRKAG